MEETAYVVKEAQGEFGKTLLVISGPFARIYHWGNSTAYSWECFEYVLGDIDKALKRYRGLSKGKRAKRNLKDFVSRLPAMEAFESGIQEDGSILYREDGAGSGKEISTLDELTVMSGLTYCLWDWKPWEHEDDCPFEAQGKQSIPWAEERCPRKRRIRK
jgi:hypothetical protein